MRIRAPKDFWAGLVFIAIGGGFILLAQQYRLGDLHRMGPAMFPTLVGAVLAGLGAVIALRSLVFDGEAVPRFYARPIGVSLFAIVSFGIALQWVGLVAAVARQVGNPGNLWVATTTGRVFLSKNANGSAGSVTFTRLDSLPGATAAPGRFVTSIYIDRSDSNHAWISYSGYNFNTPSQPGHVFSVTYDPKANGGAGDATWTNLDGGTGPMGDLPVTALVRTTRGDLYAGTDFGVMRLPNGTSTWVVGGTGLPEVEVAGLTLANGSQVLYAATHGRSVWSLKIP